MTNKNEKFENRMHFFLELACKRIFIKQEKGVTVYQQNKNGVVKLKHGLIWMCGERKKVLDYHVLKK